MRLLVVSQYFSPENFRINDLVAGLMARGHQVTVLTGQPNYPQGRFFAGYGWLGPRHETLFGAEVVRVPLIPRGTGGGLRLMLNYLSFVVTGIWGALFRLRGGFDAIFVFEVSPVTVGIPAIVASRRFRAPVLFWVLDLWPESLEATGAVRHRGVLALVERGEAPLGIVYATDAAISDRIRVLATFQESTHDPIRYSFALVADQSSPTAMSLIAFMGERRALNIFRRHGFLIP